MAEKTEKATSKKLRDARKKGQVAKSQDFPAAITFIVSIVSVLVLSGYLFKHLTAYMITAFSKASAPHLASMIPSIVYESMSVIAYCSFPILLITAIVGVLTNFIIVGPVFAPEAIKFKLEKLNPVNNLKNIFKFKTIFELLKSIFKIAGAVFLIWTVIWENFSEIVAAASFPVMGSAKIFGHLLLQVVIRVGIFFIAMAIFDLIYQKRTFAKQMMMEKFEIKQEYRDTEGDPHIKGRRKQMAHELAYEGGPVTAKKARVIVTNPIHIAVALAYHQDTEPTPRILTMGIGTVADLILKYAVDSHVPIMRNVPLAHMLYEKGKAGDLVPEETYQAVAEILRWLEGLETAEGIGKELFK